jgi:carbonic anhydrase/acetyltransferase-like protein (isoleucine patch superfamily)
MKRTLFLLAIAAALAMIALRFSDRSIKPQAAAQAAPSRAYPAHPAASEPGMNIDPTAFVHPTVILLGRVTIGPYAYIDAGTILTGDVTVGHHSLIRCNVTIRGRVRIGNYTHIYDNVNIEGGRPAKPTGGSLAEVADQAIIGDHCWINHGAIMHGTQIGDGGAVGLNTACDYNTRIGKGAILANGSATRVGMEICENCFAEGVPASIKRKNLTEKDRAEYFGVSPADWTIFEGDRQEAAAKKRMSQQR